MSKDHATVSCAVLLTFAIFFATLVQLLYFHHFFTHNKMLQTEAVSTCFRFRQLRAVAGAPRPRSRRDPREPSKPRALPARTPAEAVGEWGSVLFEERSVWSLEGFGGRK